MCVAISIVLHKRKIDIERAVVYFFNVQAISILMLRNSIFVLILQNNYNWKYMNHASNAEPFFFFEGIFKHKIHIKDNICHSMYPKVQLMR